MELCVERETRSAWRGTKWEPAGRDGRGLPVVEALEAPADLGSWFCPATVLAWVALEVEVWNWNDFQPADRVRQFPLYQRKLMLCVLAYAYARQMFDAEEIARACEADPALRRFCGGRSAFPADLQRFRRSHRAALEKILTGVFERAIRHRFDLGRMSLPADMEGDLRRLAAERLDIARHMEAIES